MIMEIIWVLLVAVVTINITEAKSLTDTGLEMDIIESDDSKTSNLSLHDMTRKWSITLFPNRSHGKGYLVITLNPTMKTVKQSFELGKYRKSFMKILLIKDNNKDNVKVAVEVPTKRSLMQRKNCTVIAYDVDAKPVHKKYNWNNRNSTTEYTANSEKSKNKMNIIKRKKGLGEETQNFNRGDTSIDDHDLIDFEKQRFNNTTNTHVDIGLRKSKILLFFPKINLSNHSKVNSENKTSSNEVNDHSNVEIKEDKDSSTIPPEVVIQSDFGNLLDEVIEPKENISDEERKDQEEYIYVKEVKQKAVANTKRDVSGNGAMTNDKRFRFYTFMKHKLS